MSDKDLTVRFIEAFNYLKKMALVKSAKDFSLNIGVSQSLISEAKAGRTNVKYYKIQKMTEVYGISKLWLLTGEGEMLHQSTSNSNSNININTNVGGDNFEEIKGNIKNVKNPDRQKADNETIKLLNEKIEILKDNLEIQKEMIKDLKQALRDCRGNK